MGTQTCSTPDLRRRASSAIRSDIWTRGSFEALLSRERAVAESLDISLALLTFDVAHHKRPNAMIRFNDSLRENLRPHVIAGRLAGNRLGVLYPSDPSASPDDVDGLVLGLRQDLAEDWDESFGPVVAWYPNGAKNRRFDNDAATAMPWWKRTLDIVVASIVLVLASPLMLLVALYIKLTSRGPVFFRQERVGYLGRTFTIWKFRTMKLTVAPMRHKDYVCQLTQTDCRLKKPNDRSCLIPLAHWLRALCIDELPQVFNVLGGSMTLVGPRPDVIPLNVYKPWQMRRFMVVPGMTGLWQVSGKNRTTFDEMVRLDISYGQKISFWLDVSIIARTVPAIIRQLVDGSSH